MSAYSSNAQGRAAQQQANFQAGTADYNAQIANQNAQLNEVRAQEAIAQGAVDEERQRENVRSVMGTQRAKAAASGVVVDQGSAGAIQDETAAFGEEDAQTIRRNAARAAWGYRMDAVNDQSQATALRIEGQGMRASGKAAAAQGRAEAASTLITGGTNLYASSKGGWDKVWKTK